MYNLLSSFIIIVTHEGTCMYTVHLYSVYDRIICVHINKGRVCGSGWVWVGCGGSTRVWETRRSAMATRAGVIEITGPDKIRSRGPIGYTCTSPGPSSLVAKLKQINLYVFPIATLLLFFFNLRLFFRGYSQC